MFVHQKDFYQWKTDHCGRAVFVTGKDLAQIQNGKQSLSVSG